MTKDMKRHLTDKDMQMEHKCWKRCSALLVIQDLQSRASVRNAKKKSSFKKKKVIHEHCLIWYVQKGRLKKKAKNTGDLAPCI